MDFGQALTLLKAGHRLTRAGWNGKGMYLGLAKPSTQSELSLPYLYLKTVDGATVPWQASQTDILAEDWDAHPERMGVAAFNPRGLAPAVEPKDTTAAPVEYRDTTWADVVAYGEENGLDVNTLLLKAAANVARYEGVKVPAAEPISDENYLDPLLESWAQDIQREDGI